MNKQTFNDSSFAKVKILLFHCSISAIIFGVWNLKLISVISLRLIEKWMLNKLNVVECRTCLTTQGVFVRPVWLLKTLFRSGQRKDPLFYQTTSYGY